MKEYTTIVFLIRFKISAFESLFELASFIECKLLKRVRVVIQDRDISAVDPTIAKVA